MKHFIIRYGVFTILVIMLVGIVCMMTHYELYIKQPVTVAVQVDGSIRAYTQHSATFDLCEGDTLAIFQTTEGDLTFAIVGMELEPSWRVLHLLPVEGSEKIITSHGNTCLEGFLYVGKERILDLTMKKMGLR